jgi:hypothetical protein
VAEQSACNFQLHAVLAILVPFVRATIDDYMIATAAVVGGRRTKAPPSPWR